jgi:hypothetical protein
MLYHRLAVNQDIIKMDNNKQSYMKGLKTSFIKRIKVQGALAKPNGITNHSYKPNFILKAVFYSSPNFILI